MTEGWNVPLHGWEESPGRHPSAPATCQLGPAQTIWQPRPSPAEQAPWAGRLPGCTSDESKGSSSSHSKPSIPSPPTPRSFSSLRIFAEHGDLLSLCKPQLPLSLAYPLEVSPNPGVEEGPYREKGKGGESFSEDWLSAGILLKTGLAPLPTPPHSMAGLPGGAGVETGLGTRVLSRTAPALPRAPPR